MKALECLKAAMENNKPLLLMIIIQVIYTGQSLFSKAAVVEGMKPAVFVTYRQALATLVLAPFAFFFEGKKINHPLPPKLLCKMFFLSLFGCTASLNFFLYALRYVSATFGTAMCNTIPASVFIMSVCLRYERLNLKQWNGVAKVIGAIIGLAGAMVFTFYKGPPLYAENVDVNSHHPARVYTRQEWIKGSILLLGGNVSWSLWLVLQNPILKEYPAKLRFTMIQCCFSSLISAAYGAALERDISSWKLGWDVNLLSVAYCGVVVTAISYWLQVWVIEKKGPVYTAIFSPLALILTGVFSAIIFKETLHLGSLLGGLLLVAGLYSYLWGKNEEAKKQPPNEDKTNQAKEEVALEGITCISHKNEVGGDGLK